MDDLAAADRRRWLHGYFFIIYHILGVGLPVFGLMFFVYWAAIMKQDLSAFFPALLGGLMGIFVAWLLVAVTPLLGTLGLAISLGTIGTVLFCFMRGHAFFSLTILRCFF